MGAVWEAEQLSMKRRVALKLLLPQFAPTRDMRARFQREAEAGGRLAHPGIVQTHAVGEHEGVQYIAQELVAGSRSLSDELDAWRRAGEQPPEHYRRLAELFVQLADALGSAHENGVVHRDVKPGNVLLTAEGTPKLADFGIALVEDALTLSTTGQLLGTPYYMSPEQASARRGVIDQRSDVFSLGATLYEALTLRRPFEGDTWQQVCQQILSVDPPDARSIRSRVPRDLSVICQKAMEKRSDQRYASMREFAGDLRRHLGDETILARAPGPVRRTVKWTRRHPVLTTSAVLVVLALSVVASLMLELKEETRIALENAQRADREGYSAQLAALQAALGDGNPRQARRRLEQCPEELRGWEWDHLRVRLDPHLVRIDGPQGNHDLAWSSDGRWLAAGGKGIRPLIWNASTGAPHDRFVDSAVPALMGDTDPTFLYMYGVAFSDDGTRVYSALTDGQLLMWTVGNGELLTPRTEFELTRWGFFSSAFDEANIATTSDGSLVVTWAFGTQFRGRLRWWDSQSGRELAALSASPPFGVPKAFLADGRRLAMGSEVWDIDTGELSLSLAGPVTASLSHVSVGPGGRVVTTDRHDGVRIWDTETGVDLEAWAVDGLQHAIFDPRGDLVATGSSDGTVRLWDASTGAIRLELSGHLKQVCELAFSLDGRLASLDYGGAIRVWSLREIDAAQTIDQLPTAVTSLAWSRDGIRVAAGTDEGAVACWDVATRQRELDLGISDAGVTDLVFGPEGRYLAAATAEGEMRIWHADDGTHVTTIQTGREPIESLAFLTARDDVVSLTADGTLRTHELRGGTERSSVSARLPPPSFPGQAAAREDSALRGTISQGGVLVVTAPLRGGMGPSSWGGSPAVEQGLLPQPDGGGLLSGHQVWTVEDAMAVSTLMPGGQWTSVSISNDAAHIAAGIGSEDAPGVSIEVWTRSGSADARGRSDASGPYITWTSAKTEAPRPVHCLAFSPDGERLVAGGQSGELQIWSVEPFAHLVDLHHDSEGPAAITAVAFSPDGSTLASADAEGRIRLWLSAVNLTGDRHPVGGVRQER